MTEERLNFTKLREIGVVEKAGRVVARDFMVVVDEKKFVLTVASKTYLSELKQYNESFEKDSQLFESMLPLENVEDENDVISSLSKMDRYAIIPYLIEQEQSE